MQLKKIVWNTSLVVSMLVAGVGMSYADEVGGGGGVAMGPKKWDCSTTGCGAAGNDTCPSGESRCCCSNGASPAVYTAACMAGGDCGGSSLCTLCQ